jgi:hypothetical protein
VDGTPPTSDREYWEPGALALIEVLKKNGGSMSLRGVKTAMRYKGYKVHITVNLLSYLDLTDRASYNRAKKVWYLC